MATPTSALPTGRRPTTHNIATTSTLTAAARHCTPFTLPSNGELVLNPTSTVTLDSNAIFTPECIQAGTTDFSDGISSITDVKDPFHASVTPQAYATGAATVIAWMLVVMLLITPRTFFVPGAQGGVGLLGRRGMISGAQGSASVIGVGSRPWLQKVAALTVAVSLTIATADTFEVAERQYVAGFMNAEALRAEVVSSTQIKVSRVISDIFLWLAQVQTLIRLFPRHKEKVLIKWIGFALIILDSTFSCLNSFMANPVIRPRRFRDAIPALSYLFQLALSMLYAAWVIYYSLCKRRYAFYHSNMWNISLVAALSLVAILTPVVFFITDISNASVAGWGDYFRWVGAAAASVIVWEWVERIEALEREEKKDGILGREVFDGDEMIESTNYDDNDHWAQGGRGGTRRFWANHGSGNLRRGAFTSATEEFSKTVKIVSRSATRRTQNFNDAITPSSESQQSSTQTTEMIDPEKNAQAGNFLRVLTPPPVAVSPVSRSETNSAASTVYTVRYHNINFTQPRVARVDRSVTDGQVGPEASPLSQEERSGPSASQEVEDSRSELARAEETEDDTSKNRWHVGNPFKRRKVLPPEEVLQGQIIDPVAINPSSHRKQPIHQYHPWDIKGRLGAFAAEQGEKWRERTNRAPMSDDLPVHIIPAQRRGEMTARPWSPDEALQSRRRGRPTESPSLSSSTAALRRSFREGTSTSDEVLTSPSTVQSSNKSNGLPSPAHLVLGMTASNDPTTDSVSEEEQQSGHPAESNNGQPRR